MARGIAAGFAMFCVMAMGPMGVVGHAGQAKPAAAQAKPAVNAAAKALKNPVPAGEIFTTIKMGVPPKFDMDSWDGRISDKDIWTLVNYIRTFGPKTAAKPAAKK